MIDGVTQCVKCGDDTHRATTRLRNGEEITHYPYDLCGGCEDEKSQRADAR